MIPRPQCDRYAELNTSPAPHDLRTRLRDSPCETTRRRKGGERREDERKRHALGAAVGNGYRADGWLRAPGAGMTAPAPDGRSARVRGRVTYKCTTDRPPYLGGIRVALGRDHHFAWLI